MRPRRPATAPRAAASRAGAQRAGARAQGGPRAAHMRPGGCDGTRGTLGRAARRAGNVLARLGLGACALCLGVVALVAVLSTVWLKTDTDTHNLTQSMSIITMASSVSMPMLGAGALGAVLAMVLVVLAWRLGTALDGMRGLRLLVAVTFVAQLVMVLSLQSRRSYWGDSWMIADFATRAAEDGVASLFQGPYGTLYTDARLYFACYPFQASFFWLLYGLRLVFGELSYVVFQLLSVGANELAVVSLMALGANLGLRERGMRVLWVLVALCLPLCWLAAFIYGNAMGCGFALAFVAMQARAMGCVGAGGVRGVRGSAAGGRMGALAWIVASVVPLALALCIKATFVLFAIGAVLAWVVFGLSRLAAAPVVACVAVVAVAHSLAGLPFQALAASSEGYEFGEALTTLNHLELGLRMGRGEFYVSVDEGEPTFAPGGWSEHATAVWAASGEDAAVQNATAARLLAADLVGFAQDPAHAAWFFLVKLATEWADPTYQSLYYLSMSGTAWGVRANPADLGSPLGIACTALTFVLDGYQSVCFVAAFGCMVAGCRGWRHGRREAQAALAAGAPGDEGCGGAACVVARAVGSRDAGALGEASAGRGAWGSSASGDSSGSGVPRGIPDVGAAPASGSVAETAASTASDGTLLLLAAIFFTGFGCYLLWEAKSVYVLPFAVVALPLGAAGMAAALSWLERMVRARASRNGLDG